MRCALNERLRVCICLSARRSRSIHLIDYFNLMIQIYYIHSTRSIHSRPCSLSAAETPRKDRHRSGLRFVRRLCPRRNLNQFRHFSRSREMWSRQIYNIVKCISHICLINITSLVGVPCFDTFHAIVAIYLTST